MYRIYNTKNQIHASLSGITESLRIRIKDKKKGHDYKSCPFFVLIYPN